MQVQDLPAGVQSFAQAWLQLFNGTLEQSRNDPDPAKRKVFADQAHVMGYTLKALGVEVDVGAPPPVALEFHAAVVQDPPPPPPPPLSRKAVTPDVNGGPGDLPVIDTPIDIFSAARVDGPLSAEAGRRMAIAVARQLQVDFNLTPQQAAGIVGNFWHESAGMNSNVNEFGSDPQHPTYGQPNKTLFGYGWAQWTGERKTAYLAFCDTHRLEYSSPAANYAFLKHELTTTESYSLGKVRETRTVAEAARAYMLYNERPTNPVFDKRVAAAETLYPLLA
jgi:hypothetical protein